MGTRNIFSFSAILKKEHPSKPGTGLRFLYLRRGLTCIISFASTLFTYRSLSSVHTPIIIVRFISTVGAHRGAELISNRRDGILFILFVDSRLRAHRRRDLLFRV